MNLLMGESLREIQVKILSDFVSTLVESGLHLGVRIVNVIRTFVRLNGVHRLSGFLSGFRTI